ncbi:MAG: excinuclease ABC subunit UvrB, partial [Acidobacteria bacterium]|nr:excinuclease ABC subunit UvrB [Acidobacteriota bacterium]
PNKTLAAQLFGELRKLFPENAVQYFVSYYDYYQPEAYIPRTDTFIEKDAQINEEIDRLRLAATSALFERRDVVIVASVSCIYGLGSPEDYGQVVVELEVGAIRDRTRLLRHLVEIQYSRNDYELRRGTFRVRGDTLEIQPAYEENAYRVELFGDEIERITRVDSLTGEVLEQLDKLNIYPARHFMTPREKLERGIERIEAEMQARVAELEAEGKLIEAQRIRMRSQYDLEMMRELGYCNGIENYSRPIAGREEGEPPWTLLDYFPDDFLIVVDESHVMLPQIGAMYSGDRSRKTVLVEHGFRLPSALDNRPLRFEEWEARVRQAIFTSATPAAYELQHSQQVVDLVIRPTGLIDPEIEIRPTEGQVDDLVARIRERIALGQRALVTTLTKRMAEDLSEYLGELGIKVQYLHSEVETLERIEILRDLRFGVYDVVVGMNLLREGLDLPEVTLVAILDADKEGFLRSETSLVQTSGRAARNVRGRVIFYGDRVTDSMARAMEETRRRRERQQAYNTEHGIEPATILKDIHSPLVAMSNLDYYPVERGQLWEVAEGSDVPLSRQIEVLEKRMKTAAKQLEFEQAAMLRDKIRELKELQIYAG